MSLEDEALFLDKLSEATEDIQIDMAIEEILSNRTLQEKELLHRLTVYPVPVPIEGVRKISLDLAIKVLDSLVSFSLVEESFNYEYEVKEYQISALVFEFIIDKVILSKEVKVLASNHQVYQFINERKNINQALIVHKSLLKSNQKNLADNFVLSWISNELSKKGQYIKLLMNWLFPLAESENITIRYKAIAQIGIQYFHLGNYERAIKYLETAVNTYIKDEDDDTKLTIYRNLVLCYKQIGDYEKVSEYSDKASKLSIDLNSNPEKELVLLINVAEEYFVKNKIEEALENAEKALDMSKELNDKFSECTVLNNIANYYIKMENIKEARLYNQKSLDISKKSNYEKLRGIGLITESEIYDKSESFGEALKRLQEALALFSKIYDRPNISLTFFRLGIHHLKQGTHMGAMVSFSSAYLIAKEIKYFKVLNGLQKIEKKLGFSSSNWDEVINNHKFKKHFNMLAKYSKN